jgi:hypothetical protein
VTFTTARILDFPCDEPHLPPELFGPQLTDNDVALAMGLVEPRLSHRLGR